MNLFTYLSQKSWKLLSFAALLGLLSGLCGATLAKLVSDGILGRVNAASNAPVYFSVCLAYLALKSGSELSLLHLTQSVVLNLRTELSRRVLATPQRKLELLGKQELQAILTNDVGVFTQAFQMIPLAFNSAAVILTCFAYMAWLSWQLFIGFAACLAIGVVLYLGVERRPLEKLERLREQMRTLYLHFRNLIEGSKELQLNSERGAVYTDRVINQAAAQYRDGFIDTMTWYTWLTNTGATLFYLAIGALLFVLPGWFPTSKELIATYSLILLFLIRPISELITSFPSIRQAGVSFGRIQQLEQSLSTSERGSPAENPFGKSGNLQLVLEGVSHTYSSDIDDREFSLGPLDLTFLQGEIVFVVGGNGSGKTTFAMLLLGLYEPDCGSISLNGVSVAGANRSAYRNNWSAVFSDFHLFEHVQSAGDDRSDIAARHYLERFHLGEVVRIVDGRFTTTDLSGGQKKRLALVTAFVEDRSMYLFDEWAADQDPVFKRIFYSEVLQDLKARGKVVIVISHDDAYFSYADRIVTLADGGLGPSASSTPPLIPSCRG